MFGKLAGVWSEGTDKLQCQDRLIHLNESKTNSYAQKLNTHTNTNTTTTTKKNHARTTGAARRIAHAGFRYRCSNATWPRVLTIDFSTL